jgi:hypothetical protein
MQQLFGVAHSQSLPAALQSQFFLQIMDIRPTGHKGRIAAYILMLMQGNIGLDPAAANIDQATLSG